MIFNIVFFISLTSVLLQGTTLNLIAKWLNVSLPEAKKPEDMLDTFLSEQAKKVMQEITVPEDGFASGKKIVDLHFPRTALIAMINRNKEYLTPNGSTVIEPNDTLVILADTQQAMNEVHEALQTSPKLK